MDEPQVQVERVEKRKTIDNTVATLALVVAVGALVLAWLAYDRQTIIDTKDSVRKEKREFDGRMEDAARKTEKATREGVGNAVQKTGEVVQDTGSATQAVGSDIKNDK